MEKIRLTMLLGAALGLLIFGWSMPGVAHATPQALCPVLGNKIDKNVFVDYHGERIYFCCSVCEAQFTKNPGKYMKKMQDEGVSPAKAP